MMKKKNLIYIMFCLILAWSIVNTITILTINNKIDSVIDIILRELQEIIMDDNEEINIDFGAEYVAGLDWGCFDDDDIECLEGDDGS